MGDVHASEASRLVWLSSTVWLRTEAPEFVPANLIQSDIGPDKGSGQLRSVCLDTGSSGVTVDRLKEQQIMDIQLHVIRGWLEYLVTMPNGNTLIAPRYSSN